MAFLDFNGLSHFLDKLKTLFALDSNVVHKTGNEIVTGEKSFSSNVLLKHNSIEYTTIPASDSYRGLYFTDKNDATLARIMYYKNTTGTTGLAIGLKANNGANYLTGLSITATTDGEVRAATSSSPALDDSSNKIATTAWARGATGDFACNAATATKATNDIDGNAIKTTYAKLASPTFTGTPKAPTASASTNNTQIATTAFVKTAISNLVSSAPWSSTKLYNATLAEATTATSTNPYTLTTTDFGAGYKELFIRLEVGTAQPTAATLRFKITFSNNSTLIVQSSNGISTSANNYVCIKAGNYDCLLFGSVCRSAGNPSTGAWYSLNGNTSTYMPQFAGIDDTITKIKIWSTSTSVTQLPSGMTIMIWGRK